MKKLIIWILKLLTDTLILTMAGIDIASVWGRRSTEWKEGMRGGGEGEGGRCG